MHVIGCEAAAQERAQAAAEWRQRWPAACGNCHGEGGRWSSYDPSPAGVSLSPGSMQDYDPCCDCVEQGCCPRCAGPVGEEIGPDLPCPGCGWTGRGADDVCPPPHECYCWIDGMDDYVD